jgi:hypothetical protein
LSTGRAKEAVYDPKREYLFQSAYSQTLVLLELEDEESISRIFVLTDYYYWYYAANAAPELKSPKRLTIAITGSSY